MIDIIEVKPIDQSDIEYYIKLALKPETKAQAEKEIASLPHDMQQMIYSSVKFREGVRRFHQANANIDAQFQKLRDDINRKTEEAMASYRV